MSISEINPNMTDSVSIKIDKPLATSQGSASKLTDMVKAIRDQLKDCPYLITCDLAVHFTFFVDERVRYETHLAPDVDNVIKKALDAICGPKGIIINDTQVQYVTSKWIDDEVSSTDSEILIEPDEKSFLEKDKIVFVKFYKNLCIPLPIKGASDVELEYFKKMLEIISDARKNIEKSGGKYHDIRPLMPAQRVFHTTKLGGFKVIDLSDLTS